MQLKQMHSYIIKLLLIIQFSGSIFTAIEKRTIINFTYFVALSFFLIFVVLILNL